MAEAKHTEVTKLVLDVDDSQLKQKLAALAGAGVNVGGSKSTSSATTPTPINPPTAGAAALNPAAQVAGIISGPQMILEKIALFISSIAADVSHIASIPAQGGVPTQGKSSRASGFAGAGSAGVFGGVSIDGTAGVVAGIATGAVGAIVGASERVAGVLNQFVDNFALFNQKSAAELVAYRVQQIQARFTIAKAIEPATTGWIKLQENILRTESKFADVINVFSGLLGKAVGGLGDFVSSVAGSANNVKIAIAAVLETIGGFSEGIADYMDKIGLGGGAIWTAGKALDDAGHKIIGGLPPEQMPGESDEFFKKRLDQWKKENPGNLNNPDATPGGAYRGRSDFRGMQIGGVPPDVVKRAQRKTPPGQNMGGYSGGSATRPSDPPMTQYHSPNNLAPRGGPKESEQDYQKRLDDWYDVRDKYEMPERGKPARPRTPSSDLNGSVKASRPETNLNFNQSNSFSVQHEQALQDGLASVQNNLMRMLDVSRDESALALSNVEAGFLARAM